MNLSLNETESLAKRATRGAGYTWGMAEEAGKATRWLHANCLDGLSHLVYLLDCAMAESIPTYPLAYDKKVWQTNGNLCPLTTGAYLSDSARLLSLSELEIHNVTAPLLLLPFVSTAAGIMRQTLSINCDQILAATDGSSLNAANQFPLHAHIVKLKTGAKLRHNSSQHSRAIAESDALKKLNQFASATFAPETEQSRLLGAGAGLSDND